jgi:hypothetical protein
VGSSTAGVIRHGKKDIIDHFFRLKSGGYHMNVLLLADGDDSRSWSDIALAGFEREVLMRIKCCNSSMSSV